MKLLVLLLVGCGSVFAQAAQTEAQQSQAALVEELERENAGYIRMLRDFGGLTRYGSENAEMNLDPKVNRVVFLGDEVTEDWSSEEKPFFPGKPYINRGIKGQTTTQMLVRFRQDVVSLKPKVVVIQGGSNDLAGNTGPATEGTITEFIMTMSELARAHGIKVVLASVTPVCDCYTNLTLRRPPGKIIGLNGWLKDYASRTGAVFLDYYSALVQGRSMRKELTVDGLVPNEAGYALMTPLAEKAIAQALGGN